ncbi:MAG: HAMP domain-containing histidine kinase [Acidobacteria bacterium]|nr:HAMP domain-containing histidine kinase [Acidobacteriota bacterium]MCW5967106.1 HAMP domain-containing histidine kinase [Blastocatellales bacterium]
MNGIKSFLKTHALWLGLVAVIVPLLAHLGLQYRSLAELESTVPVARRAMMLQFLRVLNREITQHYRTNAEKVLNLEPVALAAGDYDVIVAHFSKYSFSGARRLFIGEAARSTGNSYASIRFFNPAKKRLETDSGSPDWRAAHAGAATWLAMALTDTVPKSPQLTVDERDPKHRLVVKPIIDDQSRVIGVAGMILDDWYFLNRLLPDTVAASLPKHFPDNAGEVIVSVIDRDESLIYANQQFEGKKYETGGPLPFIFTDWYLGARMKNWTEAEMARRTFVVNFSISILTSFVLLGGIILALRTASREIKLSRMKAEFVSNVSHELRTPLASIRVFGEFLKLGRVTDTSKTREYGEYIEAESRRLTQLINNILDFSKIESGQKTYRFEPEDLRPIVENTLKLLEVRLAANGFQVNFDPPDSPLPPAIIDREALTQAVINLLDNAVKYSGAAREITVRLRQSGKMILISVIDRGVGIERAEFDKIFEKFYRVSTGLVHNVKGSGLGLSIVKHVAEAHKGRVTVESAEGRGSSFTLHIPVAEIETVQDSPPPHNDAGALPRIHDRGLGA